MKYAKKFMVVPFINLQENPEAKFISELDRDMGDILIDDKLPTDEKVKLYNIALFKYNKNYNPQPQSEESSSLNKINHHLESFVDEIKKEKPSVDNDRLFKLFEDYNKNMIEQIKGENLDETKYDYFEDSINPQMINKSQYKLYSGLVDQDVSMTENDNEDDNIYSLKRGSEAIQENITTQPPTKKMALRKDKAATESPLQSNIARKILDQKKNLVATTSNNLKPLSETVKSDVKAKRVKINDTDTGKGKLQNI